MKIGVITTQHASNYGALLQTYALQKYLNSYPDFDAEVLNYYPPFYKRNWHILPNIKGNHNFKVTLKNTALLMESCLHPKRIAGKKSRFEKYKNFVKENIKCSKPYFSKEDIESDPCPYDILIAGSDQIWNANIIKSKKIDKVWFLGLEGSYKNVKKIAYAPSVADKIPEDQKPLIKELLKDFKAVSVRESSDIKQIEPLYGGEVRHVCDPVFLLDKKRWSDFSKEPEIKEPYICCYFLNPSAEAVEIVKEIKRITGLKTVLIDINDREKIKPDIDILDASPKEFVGLIKNAEMVITNSFHATAFSVIFEKDLIVVKKKTANSRMESLLKVAGISDRIKSLSEVKNMSEKDLKTDYNSDSDKLADFIKNSEDYLKSALREEN